MVITLEQFLNAWSFKLGNGFLHLLSIRVFPLTVSIFGIKVVLSWWRDERGGNLLAVELIPVVVLEPLMILKVLRTV